MNVINRILKAHPDLLDELDSLLNIENVDISKRKDGFNRVALRLDAHETAEERTLYAAMEQDRQTKLLAMQSEEEHRIARNLVKELEETDINDDIWLPRMVILRNFVSLHMQIEENNVLPVADRTLAPEDLDQLGNDFEITEKTVLKEPIAQPSCPPE